MDSEKVTISVFENSVPPFVEAEMERLHQHMYSSLAYHRIYESITGDTSVYLAWKGGRAIAIFLFRHEKGKVCVLNEQASLDAKEIERFSAHIFHTFRAVKLISFPAIDLKGKGFSFPSQRARCTEDIVLTLPQTGQEYIASLGKATRSAVKRYMNRLKRDHPSLSCKVYMNGEGAEQHIRAIVDFNKARMAGRYQSSYIDDQEITRIGKLVNLCGLVSVMTINGKICAGTINYRFGENYFLHVVAHDPLYDDYGLGTLCCYLTICECIARGGKEYHFLWGQYEYKFRLLGIQRQLEHVALYRSHLQMLLNLNTAFRIACKGYAYDSRTWLLKRARRKDTSSLTARFTFRVLNDLKKVKRLASRLSRLPRFSRLSIRKSKLMAAPASQQEK